MVHSPNIYLWGFMGSGKTRLGKRLAAKLGKTFIDLDAHIVSTVGMSIPEIFRTEGEQAFRRYENQALQELAQIQDHIIACGGGTPCHIDNKSLMKHNGVVLFLEVGMDILVDRLWRNKESRPLIAQFSSQDEMRTYITSLLEQRMIYYRHAHMSYNNTFPRSDLSDLQEALNTLLEQKKVELNL